MSEFILINNNGKSYTLQKLPDENISHTYQRLIRIIKHNPQDEQSFQQLENISKSWSYKKIFQCSYSQHIEKLIKEF